MLAANFFQNAHVFSTKDHPEIDIYSGGHSETRLVTPIFYRDRSSSPAEIFYAHSSRSAIWVNAIEKGHTST